MNKRWWIPVIALLLVAAVSIPVSAGVLTAGKYTYILKGRELQVPVDILSIQGGYLIPESLMTALGVVSELNGDVIHVQRGPVDVQLTMGVPIAFVEGRKKPLKVGPMEASDRLFLPADILPYLGLALVVDGRFVLLEDYGPGDGVPGSTDPEAYNALWTSHTIMGRVQTASDTSVKTSITLLTDTLLRSEQLSMPWGTRLRLLSMVQHRTLLLVAVSNDGFRSVSIDPTKLLLTDNSGRQYDYQGTEVEVDGAVTTAIAPGAKRTSVLVYDAVTGPVFVYDDTGHQILGRVTGP
jgi:hypothetical protein